MGYLNADLTKSSTPNANKLLDSLAISHTKTEALTPTRVTSNTATCIDIIAIDEDLNFVKYSIHSNAASDHFPVVAVIEATFKHKLAPIVKRSFKHVNFNRLSEKVYDIALDTDLPSVDHLLENWQLAFTAVIDQFAPLKEFPLRKQRSPWVTPNIKRLMSYRDSIARKLSQKQITNTETDIDVLTQELQLAKRQVKSRIRREAKDQGTVAMLSRDPKDAWKFLKTATFTEKGNTVNVIDQETLNTYFASVVTAKDKPNSSLNLISLCDQADSFNIAMITERSVCNSLAAMKTSAASGHDRLPGIILKKIAPAIAPNITTIFNRSIQDNYFPTNWKKANISAIWKGKGTKKTLRTTVRSLSYLYLPEHLKS